MAAMQSTKNYPLAVTDLGLGDQLQSQVEADQIERKKKLLKAGQTQQAGMGAPGFGMASNALFGTGGFNNAS